MDWGRGWQILRDGKVDIQRAFSVISTIAIKWKWTFTVRVLFQQLGKFFRRRPFVKPPFYFLEL